MNTVQILLKLSSRDAQPVIKKKKNIAGWVLGKPFLNH